MNSYPEYHMFSDTQKDTFKSILMFSFKSFVGRCFLNKKPKLNIDSKNYLNLGCGENHIQNWVNCDFYVIKSWAPNKPNWMQDFRYPLNCNNGIFDGLLTEHVLEHLNPKDAYELLKECYRILRSEAWIRISVPDLRKYVAYFNKNLENDFEFSSKWNTGAEAIHALTQKWGHRSTWDVEILAKLLTDIGFKNISEKSFSESSDEALLKNDPGRTWESLYIEAQK